MLDVLLERLEHGLPVTAAERLEQRSMLVDDRVEVACQALAAEVHADSRRDAVPDLHGVELRHDLEHRFVERDVGVDDGVDVAGGGRGGHHAELLRDRLQIGGGHHVERLREGEALEHQPDRDQDPVDLLGGDGQHLDATVGVGDQEPLVLELAEGLPCAAPRRAEPFHHPVLDEPVPRCESTVEDGLS